METASANRLISESSPYLRQHAYNPVDWFIWSKEALDRARNEDKLVLLSIGYSSCHWCHVMAHESFEDVLIAKVMNDLFINIKVDREERPDLDRVYQLAYQLLNRQPGGWPLTMILDPIDHLPIFAATYLPPKPRHGLPGFGELLKQVDQVYRQRRDEVNQQKQALKSALSLQPVPGDPEQKLTTVPLFQGRAQILQHMDREYGGIGRAPKFPHVPALNLLMRLWHRTRRREIDRDAEKSLRLTLNAMANGGLFDHVAGGFFRYATDDQWTIPHFEKMLYDNGLMLGLYSEAFAAFEEERYGEVAEMTAQWAINEMQLSCGAFAAALDADSDGVEGRYYLWKIAEVKAALTPETYGVAVPLFGLDQRPNFEGRYHLQRRISLAECAVRAGFPNEVAAQNEVQQAIKGLLKARRQRNPPQRDDKILTCWNSLLIKGLALAARHLSRPDFMLSAERALDFLQTHLWKNDLLYAVYSENKASNLAYLDDYAMALDATLHMLQLRWRAQDLKWAIDLADALLAYFYDREQGGFFFTAHDHEPLIQRLKPTQDDALPSGNGIATLALLQLGHLLGNSRYLEAAEKTLRWSWSTMERQPLSCCSLLVALNELLHPGQQIVLRGQSAALKMWSQRCLQPYSPQRFVLGIPNNTTGLPSALAQRAALGETVAYLCRGRACQAQPVADSETFFKMIQDE